MSGVSEYFLIFLMILNIGAGIKSSIKGASSYTHTTNNGYFNINALTDIGIYSFDILCYYTGTYTLNVYILNYADTNYYNYVRSSSDWNNILSESKTCSQSGGTISVDLPNTLKLGGSKTRAIWIRYNGLLFLDTSENINTVYSSNDEAEILVGSARGGQTVEDGFMLSIAINYEYFTLPPTILPTQGPSVNPTLTPTVLTIKNPTDAPTLTPSITPSITPSSSPTNSPSIMPTTTPTNNPTTAPTLTPTANPSVTPSLAPSVSPTVAPTKAPTNIPTETPTLKPSLSPAINDTEIQSVLQGAGIESEPETESKSKLWIIAVCLCGLITCVFGIMCCYILRGCLSADKDITMMTMDINDPQPTTTNGNTKVFISPSMYDGVYSINIPGSMQSANQPQSIPSNANGNNINMIQLSTFQKSIITPGMSIQSMDSNGYPVFGRTPNGSTPNGLIQPQYINNANIHNIKNIAPSEPGSYPSAMFQTPMGLMPTVNNHPMINNPQIQQINTNSIISSAYSINNNTYALNAQSMISNTNSINSNAHINDPRSLNNNVPQHANAYSVEISKIGNEGVNPTH